jgi:hypothetical protein
VFPVRADRFDDKAKFFGAVYFASYAVRFHGIEQHAAGRALGIKAHGLPIDRQRSLAGSVEYSAIGIVSRQVYHPFGEYKPFKMNDAELATGMPNLKRETYLTAGEAASARTYGRPAKGTNYAQDG